MKDLKKILAIFTVMFIFFTLVSCKKSKDDVSNATSQGTFGYQGKSYTITDGDYRAGNGDGAWIYLGTTGFNYVQIRFRNLGNYVIPIGTFSYKDGQIYNPSNNFSGGFITIDNLGDEINGGTVTISKDGDKYTITLNATTTKGTLKGTFSGTLKKI